MSRVIGASVAAIFVIVGAASGGANEDGPFGVRMGSPIEIFPSCIPQDEQTWYTCTSLPKNHPTFKEYSIRAYPLIGVCFVKGIGKSVSDDGSGNTLRKKMAEIVAQISKTYGRFDFVVDQLKPDSRWSSPHEWMAGLSEDQRTFGYIWKPRGNRPNHVSALSVEAFGETPHSGHVSVDFEFQNMEACDKAVKHEAHDAF